jgi:hypothetical protein
LEGNELRNSGFKMHYRGFIIARSFLLFRFKFSVVDVNREDVCDMILDKTSSSSFENAVDRQVSLKLAKSTL